MCIRYILSNIKIWGKKLKISFNIIISKNNRFFKLGDLGLSIFSDNKTELNEIAGTLKYLNKELNLSY